MKPCMFELHRPRDLVEALELLERHRDDARLIAGGQSLVPMMNLRIATPAILVDLNTVERPLGHSPRRRCHPDRRHDAAAKPAGR